MNTLKRWIIELCYSLRAAEQDNDLSGHLAAWLDVVTGRITSETRWGLMEKSR